MNRSKAKRGRTHNGARLLAGLQRKAIESRLSLADELVYALCAREEVTHLPQHQHNLIVVTAEEIFG